MSEQKPEAGAAAAYESWMESLPAASGPDGETSGQKEQGWRDEYKPIDEPREKRWLDEGGGKSR